MCFGNISTLTERNKNSSKIVSHMVLSIRARLSNQLTRANDGLIIKHMADLQRTPRTGETTKFSSKNEHNKCSNDVYKTICHQYVKKTSILWFSYNRLRKTKAKSSLPRPLSGQCRQVM